MEGRDVNLGQMAKNRCWACVKGGVILGILFLILILYHSLNSSWYVEQQVNAVAGVNRPRLASCRYVSKEFVRDEDYYDESVLLSLL